MTETERILDQLHRSFAGNAWHGPAVLELLKDVTSQQAKTKPLSGTHSIWELVLHITVWERTTQRRLEGETIEPTEEENWELNPDFTVAGWKKAKESAIETHTQLEETVKSLTDADLEKKTAGNNYTNYFLLHGVIQHNLYHAGQIALLKKTYKITLLDELFDCVDQGNAERVQELLELNPLLVNTKWGHNKTPLHLAAENNHIAIAKLLLERGAEIESETTWGSTPLQWAATCGAQETGELLLEHNAVINMWSAAALGKLEIVQSYFITPTTLKSNAGQPKAVEKEKGVWEKLPPAEEFNEIISSAFHIACRNGKLNVATFLLAKGADINHKGFFGGTGLHWAAMNGHTETVGFMVQQGADLEKFDDEFKSTPFDWAREGKQEQVMELLKRLGAKE